jgi:hypothetical protein
LPKSGELPLFRDLIFRAENRLRYNPALTLQPRP